MDQLVVLQEIYASFSKGTGSLREIDVNAIEGCCNDLVAGLLEDSLNGRIDEKICRELSDKLIDVYELKRLGDICRRAGLARLAADTYKKALSLCLDPVLSPILKSNLGQAYADQGDIRRALSCYREAADIFSREEDRISLAHVLGNLASAYRKVGDYGQALENAHSSLKIFEENGDRLGIAQMTGSIGRIYADMGEREKAARYFERSLADFQRLGDKRGAAWILSRLGGMAREVGELDRALGYMHSSISIWEEMGERANLGAALADLGSALLQMGQPSAALGPLERAVLLIPEHSRANYQRALSSLAGAYSSLAEESMAEALKVESSDLQAVEEKRQEAARLFASAADRYQELADTLPQDGAQIRSEAALARGRSYLSRIYEQMPEPEAMQLAEKAMAALESAASSSNEEKKPGILILQRITAGICQARRADPLAHDSPGIRAALSSSAEYLMQAADSLFSRSDAGSHLRRALQILRSAIETEIPAPVQEKRVEAALSLRQAVSHFAVSESENASAISRMVERAAEMLETPEPLDKLEEDGGRKNDGGQEDGSYSLAWDKERAALLALAEAMVVCHLSCLQKDYETPGRQERPETADRDRSEAEINFVDIAEEDDLAQGIETESIPPSDQLESWGRKDAKENDLVLAEGSMGDASSLSWARKERERSWDEPAQAFQNGSCLLLPREGPPLERALFQAEPGTEAYTGTMERLERDKPSGMAEEPERQLLRETFRESPGDRYNGTIYRYEAPDEDKEDTGLQFTPASDDLETEPSAHPISPRMIAALRILSILVLLLLLIEAMLYLI